MQINIVIHPHLYAEETTMDWILAEDEKECVLPKEILLALREHTDYLICFGYNMTTTLFDVTKVINDTLTESICDKENSESFFLGFFLNCIYFSGLEERFFPEKKDAGFKYLLDKYLDPYNTGTIHVEILVSMDAGCVLKEGQLRYDMRSHEGKRHKEPHVHVRDIRTQKEVSIAISDQRVLAGNISSKLLKKAKKTIGDNQLYLYKCWEEKTAGLVPDINYKFGLINY